MTTERMLKIKELADLVRVSDSTIRRAIKSRQLRAVKIGRDFRFTPSDIEAWIRSRRV